MKTHLILACFLLLNFSAGAQQKDISVVEKNKVKNIGITTSDSTSVVNGSTTPIDSTDLIVFFRPGCSRCEIFRTMLDENCIQYTSVDMSTDDPRIPQMWKDIQIQGFNGGTIHYPIIRHHGIVIWDMIDMNAFIEGLLH